ETPAATSSANPTGISSLTGQRTSPPEFDDCSLVKYESTNIGQDSQRMSRQAGSRKNTTPMISIQTCVRRDSLEDNTSTRTCSLCSCVYPAVSRNMAPNRYHCNSSQAFELVF